MVKVQPTNFHCDNVTKIEENQNKKATYSFFSCSYVLALNISGCCLQRRQAMHFRLGEYVVWGGTGESFGWTGGILFHRILISMSGQKASDKVPPVCTSISAQLEPAGGVPLHPQYPYLGKGLKSPLLQRRHQAALAVTIFVTLNHHHHQDCIDG